LCYLVLTCTYQLGDVAVHAITESETSYSLVQFITTMEWTQLWISCLQLVIIVVALKRH